MLDTSMEVWFGDEMDKSLAVADVSMRRRLNELSENSALYDIRSYSPKNPFQSCLTSLILLFYSALPQIMTRNYEYRLRLEVDG